MRSPLVHITSPLFSEDAELRATVYYFDYSNRSTRDIHNIFKGIFDALGQGRAKDKPPLVYHDDRQIVVFTGMRLDMNRDGNTYKERSFELNLDGLDNRDDYNYLIGGHAYDCFLVEIQDVQLPFQTNVQVTWIKKKDISGF